ncbi:hypothetical protein ACF0H5_017146 [Mactra antiquata]
MASGSNLYDVLSKSASASSVDVEHGLNDEITLKDVHCISCQRRGRRAKAYYYCQDCQVGLCEQCGNLHVKGVKMNRHSLSRISETYGISPNQGPFPELTEIGTKKFDVEYSLRGSTFLPDGELVVTDYSNSKIRVFSKDYTRKQIASMLVPKQNKWDEKRPKPMDITETGPRSVAFTTDTGCVYLVSIGLTMVMAVDRVIPVISFESNYGECLGLAYNDADQCLYISCSSDREGVYIKIYTLHGEVVKIARENITEMPNYLTFGLDKTKLYAADSDSVTAYDVKDFKVLEEYDELQAQTTDIFVDKYGYLYTLATERRLFKTPGSIYRLNSSSGVTKVAELNSKPSSICYNMKTGDVAVTFLQSRYIYLYKLKMRTFQKQVGTTLTKYQ